jgi:hypothetical protein
MSAQEMNEVDATVARDLEQMLAEQVLGCDVFRGIHTGKLFASGIDPVDLRGADFTRLLLWMNNNHHTGLRLVLDSLNLSMTIGKSTTSTDVFVNAIVNYALNLIKENY